MEVATPWTSSADRVSSGMGQFSQQGADQGCFTGTVLADQDGKLSAVDMHGHILEQDLAAAADADPVQIDVAELAVVQGHDLPSSLKFGTC